MTAKIGSCCHRSKRHWRATKPRSWDRGFGIERPGHKVRPHTVQPASLVVSTALVGVLVAVALFGWFASLWRGRMPHGLRDLGATIVRYHAQTHAYLLLVTPRYPYACPVVEGAARSPEPAALGPAAA